MPLARRARGIAVSAVVWVFLVTPARADEAPPKFEGGIEIVAVDANVVDGKGQPVRDLSPDEFVVKVDGRTRRVLSADFIGLQSGPSSPGTTATGAPAEAGVPAPSPTVRREGRRFVLVVDRGQLSVGAIKAASDAASRLLDQLAPDDRVGLFSLPSGPRVDFTSDRVALEKALDRVGPVQDRWRGEFNISLAEAIAFVESRDRLRVITRECQQYLKSSRASDEEACVRRVESEAKQQVDEQETSVDDRLGALEALVQALGQIPGPKTLVLASGGFTAVTTGATPRIGHRLRRVATAAAAARVSFYSLYFSQRSESYAASQSRHQNAVDDTQQARAQGLEMLTGMSGGTMFEVVAGANFAFDRVASETSGHYLLGLDPATRDRDGKPHDIEVKVTRKGVAVRARRQFVMAAAPARSRTKPAPLRAATPASPLHVATHVLRGDSAGQIKVVLAAQVDGSPDARFDIHVLDPAGAMVGSLKETAGTILLPRGLYTLKAEAVDAGGRHVLVEKPLNAELSHGVGFDVSDLLLLETVGDRMRPSIGAIGSDTIGAYLELYMHDELPPDRIGISLDVIGADGARRSTTILPLRSDAGKGLLYAEGLVDLWALPPGAYVARARVTSGTKTARTVERAFDYKGRDAAAPRPER